jgi:glyoxylase-like metal-dependent hydrolase (beta-lactamase superfamily II)
MRAWGDNYAVNPIATGTTLADLEYLGHPGHIATCFLETDEGLAIVDPGPPTTFERFREAVRMLGATVDDVRILLLTHIHLDHSGAAGWLAEIQPKLRVFVHERGAPHLADPARLIQSATMIYGDRMQELWGTVKPVPPSIITPLQGGERLAFGDRVFRAAYTPGHAWHHLAWFDEATGIAFTGDVLGEHLVGSDAAIPVTPPPDIDVELMIESGDRVLEWKPARLFPTHFGPVDDPPRFVREHATRLILWSERVRTSLAQSGTDEDRAQRVAALCRADMETAIPKELHSQIPDDALYGNWFGLARYWRKKLERGS